MKTTRQRILEYLRAHPDSTSAELSRALQVGAADIRYHIAELVKEGPVRTAGFRAQQGRGRPAALYQLSGQEHHDSLAHLTRALLDLAFIPGDPARQENFLRQVAERLAGKPQLGVVSSSGLTNRLISAVQRLNELGYQARWEAHAGSPRVILTRCPYAELLDEHPELCRIDAYLLEKMLATPICQTAKLRREAGGGVVCIFEVGKLNT